MITNWRVVSIAAALAIVGSVGFACSRSPSPPPEPPSAKITFEAIRVAGPGKASTENSKQKYAEAIVAPVQNYYDRAFFDVDFPTEDFSAAFADFTPTVAAQAQTQGLQRETMTLAEVGSQVKTLRAEFIKAWVSMYADREGEVAQGEVHIRLQGVGRTQDGTEIDYGRLDNFYLVKTGERWVIIGYVAHQKIDAPPIVETEMTATAGPATASPSPTPTQSPSPTASPTRSPTKTPTPTSTRRR